MVRVLGWIEEVSTLLKAQAGGGGVRPFYGNVFNSVPKVKDDHQAAE